MLPTKVDVTELKSLLEERASKLKFVEESHQYFVGDQELISGTTFISSIFPKFNAKGASFGTAKAINKEFRELLQHKSPTPDSMPKAFKLWGDKLLEECRERWKFVVNGDYAITSEEVQEAWKDKGALACAFGTETHVALEDYILGKPLPSEYKYQQSEVFTPAGVEWLDASELQFIPEAKMYSLQLGIAGTADLLGIDKEGNLHILDWKTSKTIDDKGFKKLPKPYNYLEDCNLVKYSMQMYLYRYILMLEYGVEAKSCTILHLTSEGCVEIPCIDLSKEVEEILSKRLNNE